MGRQKAPLVGATLVAAFSLISCAVLLLLYQRNPSTPDSAQPFTGIPQAHHWQDHPSGVPELQAHRHVRRLPTWSPAEGKYLLGYCHMNRWSNRLYCMQRALVLAALLNRTLIIPTLDVCREGGDKTGAEGELAIDVPHLRRCLQAGTVLRKRCSTSVTNSSITNSSVTNSSITNSSVTNSSVTNSEGVTSGVTVHTGDVTDNESDTKSSAANSKVNSSCSGIVHTPCTGTPVVHPADAVGQERGYGVVSLRELQEELERGGERGGVRGEVSVRGGVRVGVDMVMCAMEKGMPGVCPTPKCLQANAVPFPPLRHSTPFSLLSIVPPLWESDILTLARATANAIVLCLGDTFYTSVRGYLVDSDTDSGATHIAAPRSDASSSEADRPYSDASTPQSDAGAPHREAGIPYSDTGSSHSVTFSSHSDTGEPLSGYFGSPCRVLFRPAESIVNKAEAFIRGPLGGQPFAALHFRRTDFASFCRESNCSFWSIDETALCVSQDMLERGLRTLFLATDGSYEEIRRLGTLFHSKGIEAVLFELPGGWRVPKGVFRKWERKRRKGNNNKGGLEGDLIEKVVCSHSSLFFFQQKSTFSNRIRHLRRETPELAAHDRAICHGRVQPLVPTAPHP